MTAPRRAPPPEAAAALIRIAMLLGVLGFGAVCWFVRRKGSAPPAAIDARSLRVLGMALWGGALVGVLVLRAMRERVRDDAGRRRFGVIAWALGEAVAIFGGVYYYMLGVPTWYVAGLAFMLGVFALFPARRD